MLKSLVKKVFPSKKLLYNDFSSVKTDIHSHLIPGIDDGVKTVDEAILLITEFVNLGFKKIITTPHIMSECYPNTYQNIFEGYVKVKEAIIKQKIDVEFAFAAEYYIDPEFEKKIGNEKFLTFGNNYLLIETSYVNQPENLKEIIFRLLAEKYKPVIAHSERYMYMFDSFNKFKELKETGVLLQLNINSITGVYSPVVKALAQKLIDSNMVDFVGSDVHNKRHMDVMKMCIKEKYCQKLLSTELLNCKL